MRMEELSDSRYIKNPDSIEKYLLNIIQEYFKNNSVAHNSSKEFIIQKAVKRMKEEIKYEGIGVLSVTLQDCKKRTGHVMVTLEDLGGEPLINPKLSAFNVNFGNEANTACEGNDPRLSDARKPLVHTHEITEINGLEGELTTIKNLIGRVEGAKHDHSNKSVLDKLTYTGDSNVIDLTILNTWKETLEQIIKEIKDNIILYKRYFENKLIIVNQELMAIDTKISDLKQYVKTTNEKYYNDSKEYTNKIVNEATTTLLTKLSDYALKTDLNPLIDIINQTYSPIGTKTVEISSDFDTTNTMTIIIDSDIIDEITKRGYTLQDCDISLTVSYFNSSLRKQVDSNLPMIFAHDNNIVGNLLYEVNYANNTIILYFKNLSKDAITDLLDDISIKYQVLCKNNFHL